MKVRTLSLALLASLILGLISVPILAQQGNIPPDGNRVENHPPRIAGPGINRGVPPQMLDRMGATETEKTAVTEFTKTKMELTGAYSTQIRSLTALLQDEKATTEQFLKAVADLEAAKSKYQSAVTKAETDLKMKLSPKIQLALYSFGVLDNGLSTGIVRRPGRPDGYRPVNGAPGALAVPQDAPPMPK